MKNQDNAKKRKSGQVFQETLEAKFQELKKNGVILSYEREKNYNHLGFEYQAQYLANFVLKTIDEKFIIVRSSNSFRGDRVKTLSWDIQGVVENSEISKEIVATILVFSDEEGENKEFVSRRKSIENGHEFSPVSHLFLLVEFLDFLDNYKDEIEAAIEDATPNSAVSSGSKFGKAGNDYEKELVAVLQDPSNLERFKLSELEEDNPFQQIVGTMCIQEGIAVELIDELKATNTVPLLRSGGNPKTDIIVDVLHRSKITKCTLSVKKSTQTKVSCHDYRAHDYIRVLDCKGEKLGSYLMKFQANPTYTAFETAMSPGESVSEFKDLMKPKATLLTEWALTGAHDLQNITPEELQVSNYIFVNGRSGTFCQPMKTYIKHLFSCTDLTFEVPLSWTYPSKQRTIRIQLKVPLVYF